jgi:hypothetical protein
LQEYVQVVVQHELAFEVNLDQQTKADELREYRFFLAGKLVELKDQLGTNQPVCEAHYQMSFSQNLRSNMRELDDLLNWIDNC